MHLPLVRTIARRFAGRGEDYDDLVQAGSVGLVRASGRFDPSRGVAFATFVTPAVEGAVRRHLSQGRRGLQPPSMARGARTDPPATELDDHALDRLSEPDSLAQAESRLLLAGGLRGLDERERRIVFLRFHADMTERQIARSVGISQAHVSRLLEGALAKLRAELGSGGSTDAGGITRSGAIPRRKVPEIASEETKIAGVGPEKEGVGAQAGDGSRQGNGRSGKTGYSGRFLVRMPSELHKELSQAAEREEISLNRYVTDALSSSVGMAPSADGASRTASGAADPADGQRSAKRLRIALATNVAVVIVAAVAAVVLLVVALQHGI